MLALAYTRNYWFIFQTKELGLINLILIQFITDWKYDHTILNVSEGNIFYFH